MDIAFDPVKDAINRDKHGVSLAFGERVIAIPADPNDPEDFDVTEAALQQALIERERRMRGLQVAPTKQQVTLRLDRDVLAKFRGTGPGWQARINAALKAATP